MSRTIISVFVCVFFVLVTSAQDDGPSNGTSVESVESVKNGSREFCTRKLQMLDAEGSCLLFLAEPAPAGPYHEIMCYKPTEEILRKSFETYAAEQCGLPLKLFVPELAFYPTSKVFHSVAALLNTVIIKSWDPYRMLLEAGTVVPDENLFTYVAELKGSPFEGMVNLKVLDIAFASNARFTRLAGKFFDGLTSLEALHIENLPPGATIARGLFHEQTTHKTLKCFGWLGSTIPCSCDPAEDSGHYLHEWLHHHQHTWSQEGKAKVTYIDNSTSDGAFFLCEVKVQCAMTLHEHDVAKKEHGDNVRRLEIPFHHFNWKNRCARTTPATTTPKSSTRTLRLVPDEEPYAAASRSAATQTVCATMTWILGLLMGVASLLF
ncbi:hypothetical protein BV898_17639 [Hypsibius exemplaris]|uniref:Ig-like domain-containing protein n=1 Tax=Hypsibius exemplaris TaxID=2072580 RepID=A0A9X6NIE2_HYPEX|nr:hypothetical protein BV898_17639 [Hypsibius exemplaris]